MQKTYEEEKAVTSIQRSLALLSLDEEDKIIFESVFNQEWGRVRDSITERGSKVSIKLICCLCSVGPPQSVIIAIQRASSRIFAQIDEKGRHPLHYLCYYGAPTFAIMYAAQCHIAALEVLDKNEKTPLEYLMTMPWEYNIGDKEEVIHELQKFSSLKCYDVKSKLPNKIALERWGHKTVIEEKIKSFMVCFIECARFEKVNWEGCCLSHVAEEINEKCHAIAEDIRNSGKIVHIDPYRLGSNQFAIIVKTQCQDDCEFVYNKLCQKGLGELKHDGVYLRIGCVYCKDAIGSNILKELLKEAEALGDVVKTNLESASLAVSASMNDLSGQSKINVSPLTKSALDSFIAKCF